MLQTVTPDVNILIAASRSDHPHHKTAYAWLNQAVVDCGTGGSLKLMPMVIASFLRLVTNPKVFVQPTPLSVAMKFLDALLATPGVEMPAIGSEWLLFRQFCLEKRLAPNDIPDVWLAAVVVQLGEHLVTFDADFKKLLGRSQVTIISPQ